MADGEVKLSGDLLQRKSPAKVGLEPFAGALDLPWRKAAPGEFSAAPQSAIGLRDVCGECEHHVIDEKLIGLVRPIQCIQQRRTEMTDHSVVMADAGLIGEFANTRRAGLFGEVVERRARQIKEDGMVWLVDDEARIALQVV